MTRNGTGRGTDGRGLMGWFHRQGLDIRFLELVLKTMSLSIFAVAITVFLGTLAAGGDVRGSLSFFVLICFCGLLALPFVFGVWIFPSALVFLIALRVWRSRVSFFTAVQIAAVINSMVATLALVGATTLALGNMDGLLRFGLACGAMAAAISPWVARSVYAASRPVAGSEP